MRQVIVAIADSHAGSKYGLLNPATQLYDQNAETYYSPAMTATQRYLWANYTESIQRAMDIANGDEVILIHNGDATHGTYFRSELVSTAAADQITIAYNNLAPWYEHENLKHVRIVSGTGVHAMGEGSSEILITQMLQRAYPQVDTKIITHGAITVQGVPVDVAHHGPHPGSRDWLSGNVARFYLRDLLYAEERAGRKPPRLVLRAHYHRPVHEYLEMGESEADLFILPPLCLFDEHAIKATASAFTSTTGITLFEVVDGELIHTRGRHRLYQTIDVRQREDL